MSLTELRRRILGRAIRPYAFAVSLATAVIAYAVLTDQAVGQLLDHWPGHLIGVMATATVALLWWGWWARKDGAMMLGLLWSAGVWSGVGTVLAVEGGAWVSAALAWCWAIASAGAWLLEVDDIRNPERSAAQNAAINAWIDRKYAAFFRPFDRFYDWLFRRPRGGRNVR